MRVSWGFLGKGCCSLEHLAQNWLKHIWKLQKEKWFCLQNEGSLYWLDSLTPIRKHYQRGYHWEHLVKVAELLELLGTNCKCIFFSLNITSVWKVLPAGTLDTRSHTCTQYNFHSIIFSVWAFTVSAQLSICILGAVWCLFLWKCPMHIPSGLWCVVLWDRNNHTWRDADRVGHKGQHVSEPREYSLCTKILLVSHSDFANSLMK